MKTITLGTTGITTPQNAFGALPVQRVNMETAVEILHRAYDGGMTFFDTARAYSDSEEKMGEAFGNGSKWAEIHAREKIFIATKSAAETPEKLRADLETSLRNLKTDYIDIYQLHCVKQCYRPGDGTGLYEVLQEAKAQGKIRHIGLCNVTTEEISQIAKETEIACVQNEYSLLHPAKGEEVFEVCNKHQISFMGYGTLGGGVLSGKYTHEPNFRRADARNYFYKVARGEGFTQAAALAQTVKKVAAQKGVSPSAIAGAWALNKADFILCGAKTAQQVVQNVQAADVTLLPEEVLSLEQIRERK